MKPDQHRDRSDPEGIVEKESEEEEEQEFKRVNQTAKKLWELDVDELDVFEGGEEDE